MDFNHNLTLPAIILAGLLLLTGCASSATNQQTNTESTYQQHVWQDDYAPPEHDPYENWNRKVFAFNDTLDAWILKPTAQGYRKITPQFMRTGIHNFFRNLGEISNLANNLLQLKPKAASKDFGRLLTNTTLGLGGLFEVATPAFGWQRSQEDFGQTLNTWGVPKGPYLVWPVLGGLNLSHVAGLPVDYMARPQRYVIDDSTLAWSLNTLQIIQFRAGFLDAEQLIQGDRYAFIRDAYLQRRTFLIHDGQLEEDPFLDEDFDFDESAFEDDW